MAGWDPLPVTALHSLKRHCAVRRDSNIGYVTGKTKERNGSAEPGALVVEHETVISEGKVEHVVIKKESKCCVIL